VIVSSNMKTSYGANDEELLLPVDAEANRYGHEESSLMQSAKLNREVRSTRYRLFTIVAVVSALFGSTLYISSSVRGKETGSLFAVPEGPKNESHASLVEIVAPSTIAMLDKKEKIVRGKETGSLFAIPEDARKSVNAQPTSKPKPTTKPTGIFTLSSILIILDCLLIVKFIISLKLP
jgi:hypothetical protein